MSFILQGYGLMFIADYQSMFNSFLATSTARNWSFNFQAMVNSAPSTAYAGRLRSQLI